MLVSAKSRYRENSENACSYSFQHEIYVDRLFVTKIIFTKMIY